MDRKADRVTLKMPALFIRNMLETILFQSYVQYILELPAYTCYI